MRTNQKRSLFDHYRNSLNVAGLTTTRGDSLICPLCWQESEYDDLSLEHIVPSSVGGTRKILTCRRCNNQHGSDLDAHLAQYQTVADALRGQGALPGKLIVNGEEVSANFELGDGSKKLMVVGKASNPAASHRIQYDFKAGSVSKFNFTFLFRYAKNNFQTAVLRAAYLAVFKCFGYEYARHDVVQVIRRRIYDRSLNHPRLGSIIFELRNFNIPYDEPHFIAPGNVNGVEFFLVIIRVRKATTTYLGAYLPVPVGRSDEFFDLMEQCSREYDGRTLTIPSEGIFT